MARAATKTKRKPKAEPAKQDQERRAPEVNRSDSNTRRPPFCANCAYGIPHDRLDDRYICRRYPQTVLKKPGDLCGEHPREAARLRALVAPVPPAEEED